MTSKQQQQKKKSSYEKPTLKKIHSERRIRVPEAVDASCSCGCGCGDQP